MKVLVHFNPFLYLCMLYTTSKAFCSVIDLFLTLRAAIHAVYAFQ